MQKKKKKNYVRETRLQVFMWRAGSSRVRTSET